MKQIELKLITKEEADAMFGKNNREKLNLVPRPPHKMYSAMGKIGSDVADEVYEHDIDTGKKKLIYKRKEK